MPTAETQISLTADEMALLIELLEGERRDLPPEIHHTRTTSFRDGLHERLDKVDHLLARLRDLASA